MPDPIETEESEFDNAFAEFAGATDSDDTPLTDDELAAAATSDVEIGDEDLPDPDAADPYDGMSDEAKTRYMEMEGNVTELNHRLSSDAGRVSALQRKVNGLQTEIEGIREGSTSGDMPDENQIKDAMMGSDEEWEKFAQDYPQVAGAIDKRFERSATALSDAVDSTLKPVKDTIGKINTDAAATEKNEKADEVAKVFPTWTTAVAEPDFKLWLDEQPAGIQGLSASPDTRDAVALLGMYDDHLVANEQPSLRTEIVPTEPGDENDSELTEIEKRRARQAAAGASIPSKPAGIDTTGEASSEFDQAFAHYARKKEARSA